eukprot:Rhum_TRINITY_DN15324_c1_g1::Rhum_TRINITY_DN15324_c1_g1_i1::g.151347::m.151347
MGVGGKREVFCRREKRSGGALREDLRRTAKQQQVHRVAWRSGRDPRGQPRRLHCGCTRRVPESWRPRAEGGARGQRSCLGARVWLALLPHRGKRRQEVPTKVLVMDNTHCTVLLTRRLQLLDKVVCALPRPVAHKEKDTARVRALLDLPHHLFSGESPRLRRLRALAAFAAPQLRMFALDGFVGFLAVVVLDPCEDVGAGCLVRVDERRLQCLCLLRSGRGRRLDFVLPQPRRRLLVGALANSVVQRRRLHALGRAPHPVHPFVKRGDTDLFAVHLRQKSSVPCHKLFETFPVFQTGRAVELGEQRFSASGVQQNPHERWRCVQFTLLSFRNRLQREERPVTRFTGCDGLTRHGGPQSRVDIFVPRRDQRSVRAPQFRAELPEKHRGVSCASFLQNSDDSLQCPTVPVCHPEVLFGCGGQAVGKPLQPRGIEVLPLGCRALQSLHGRCVRRHCAHREDVVLGTQHEVAEPRLQQMLQL